MDVSSISLSLNNPRTDNPLIPKPALPTTVQTMTYNPVQYETPADYYAKPGDNALASGPAPAPNTPLPAVDPTVYAAERVAEAAGPNPNPEPDGPPGTSVPSTGISTFQPFTAEAGTSPLYQEIGFLPPNLAASTAGQAAASTAAGSTESGQSQAQSIDTLA